MGRRYKIAVTSLYLDGLWIMRKDALAITVTSLVMGVFGAFLRWLQNRTIYEDSGLAAPGAGVSVVYVVFSVLMACGMLGVVLLWLRRYEKPRSGEAALHVDTVLPAVLSWALCAVFALSGVLLMFSAGTSAFPRMQRLFGAFAILAGACLPMLPRRQTPEDAGVSGRRAAAAVVTLFFCWWLVFSYRANAENPVLWAYAPEILAVASGTMAFYYVTGWIFGHAQPDAALFCIQLAVFLNVCTLPDERHGAMKALFAATAAALLLLEYILLANMKEASGKR